MENPIGIIMGTMDYGFWIVELWLGIHFIYLK